jgi:nucleoside 2-deoxyribosyltransferase
MPTSRKIANPKKTKLYVGCSLTGASEKFKNSIEKLKDDLRAEGYEVFDFVGLVSGTPADVYNWDIGHCVRDCDALVGICDFPSIGLGYELSVATALKKPVLAIAQKDSLVTRLVLGAAAVEPNFRFERYTQIGKDVTPLVNKWLEDNNL